MILFSAYFLSYLIAYSSGYILQLIMNYNLAIIGGSGVGKSIFIHRHKSGEFIKHHILTTEKIQTNITFHTTHGIAEVHIHEIPDTTNSEQIMALMDHMDAVIIMFDVTSMSSCLTAIDLTKLISKKCYIVVCGNKCDIPQRKVMAKDITRNLFFIVQKIKYYDISARSNYNFEKPFLVCLQHCISPDLAFIEAPPIIPAVRDIEILQDISPE